MSDEEGFDDMDDDSDEAGIEMAVEDSETNQGGNIGIGAEIEMEHHAFVVGRDAVGDIMGDSADQGDGLASLANEL